MTAKRQVEVFSAGCPVCDEAIQTVEKFACPSCAVTVWDMHDPNVAGRGPDEATLRAAGLGQPIE